jgi:hypothetical protein
MKSLQDYIDKYRDIGKNLGYTGQGVEVLVQMLANVSYIGEVENVAYMQESSLEKCSLINSKIQHCVDNMYSVFRGSCPRVLIKMKPTKYLTFNPYDEIITSQTFSVYYLGYWKPSDTDSTTGEFVYSSKTFNPVVEGSSETNTIIGFLAKEPVSETWTVNSYNTYYVDCYEENLSDDMYVKLQGDIIPRTRLFAEHILNHDIFDLTLPSFGSRLYIADYYKDTIGRSSKDIKPMTTNAEIEAHYYKLSYLEDYNTSELERLKLQGAELVDFTNAELVSMTSSSSDMVLEQNTTGIYYIKEVDIDGINTIHYKANRDRYVNSILRSNSDIGTVLEEAYPTEVKSGGTTYMFSYGSNNTSAVTIYYIPTNEEVLLTKEQITTFRQEKRAYYVITDNINVVKGDKYTAVFNISLELYNSSETDWKSTIGEDILQSSYERKFGITFNSGKLEEIKSLISKISNVKKISSMTVTYLDNNNVEVSESNIDTSISYFDIKYSISTTVTQTNTDF